MVGAPFLVSSVPPPGAGTCARCRGPARPDRAECFCCARVGGVLGEVAGCGPPVVPMAICRRGDALHGALRRYKDAPSLSARRHYAALLAAVVTEFLENHGRCLQGATGGWEELALVPSSTRGPSGGNGVCPFDAVVRDVPALARLPRLALARGRGVVGHLAPSPRAFTVAGPLRGRVLLADDTWVTGARARSAACALARAGATVVATVVVARCVDPSAPPALAWSGRLVGATPGAGPCGLPGCWL